MKELNLKQKDSIVKGIYSRYKKSQLDLLYFQQHYNYYPQCHVAQVGESVTQYQTDQKILHQMMKKQELENYIQCIDHIHTQISIECFQFLQQEYLNAYDSLWWMHYYSRASYYRMKHKVLDEFLEYIEILMNSSNISA